MHREEFLKIIINDYKCNDIIWGSMYILPDGTLLNLGDSGYGHSDLSTLLNDYNFEVNYQSGKASPLLKSLGWIRLNTKVKFVDLPKIKPTDIQYEKLLLALDYMKSDYQITCPDNQFKIYKDRVSDDVIKLIKRYYSSGILYEKLN